MSQGVCRATRFAVVTLLLAAAACGDRSPAGSPDATAGGGIDAGGTGTGGGPVGGDDGGPVGGDDGGPGGSDAGGSDATSPPDADPGGTGVAVGMSDPTLTFATPDVSRTLVATVTGSDDKSITWSSSDTYIATVTATGVVTSVSGGQAIITATSTADPSKSATTTVTIVEPDRPRATDYVRAQAITSGPINLLMCGDSLMRTYAANADDQTGWGQVLGQFLTGDASVDNTISDGGRSSRSFYNEIGRWDQIKLRLAAAQRAGTPSFVVIQFAHNDQKKASDPDGPDFLTFARHNQNGTVAGTYYDYLERYIVEARALGGIPILVTPFVREDLEGSPATVSPTGQHDLVDVYPNETTARGDYPAAMQEIAAKHDVPVVDITSWSKALVEARAAASTLDFIYISSDQTHIRQLGGLLMAQEVIRSLNEQGILTSYARAAPARLMLDTGSVAFGGISSGATTDRSFKLTPFGDVSGTIAFAFDAPGYLISVDGAAFSPSATITADASYAGSRVAVRFSPAEAISYNTDLTVAHSSLALDYGNTAANATAGHISLTGNGTAVVHGVPATATWPMFAGSAIVLDPIADGVISPAAATLTGLRNKNVLNGGARFDVPDGNWPAEASRAAGRYVEFTVQITTASFTMSSVSVGAGSGGGSNLRWDIAYSLADDFSAPTDLGTSLGGAKDTLVTSSFPGLGVPIAAGQTLHLRVYPYNTTAATGKSLMLANVIISGVTN